MQFRLLGFVISTLNVQLAIISAFHLTIAFAIVLLLKEQLLFLQSLACLTGFSWPAWLTHWTSSSTVEFIPGLPSLWTILLSLWLQWTRAHLQHVCNELYIGITRELGAISPDQSSVFVQLKWCWYQKQPKMVSAAHVNQDLLLPVFLQNPALEVVWW